jgi:prepilin-type N-terminal cleavage/methylation domain-containing protein
MHGDHREAGLTLIELAIVLVVLGIILGMTLPLLSELTRHRHYRSAQKELEEIKEALIGYAAIHFRLPNADANGDGVQDTGQVTGTIPFVDLGLGAVDPWRNAYRYDVNQRLTNTNNLQALCSALASIGATELPQVAFSAGGPSSPQAAVVISMGENSRLDEENADGDRVYEARTPTATFDDITVAIAPNALYTRLSCSPSSPGPSCSVYSVFNTRTGAIWVQGGSYPSCTQVARGSSFSVGQGQSVNVYLSRPNCNLNQNPFLVTYAAAQGADQDGDCQVNCDGTSLSDR